MELQVRRDRVMSVRKFFLICSELVSGCAAAFFPAFCVSPRKSQSFLPWPCLTNGTSRTDRAPRADGFALALPS